MFREVEGEVVDDLEIRESTRKVGVSLGRDSGGKRVGMVESRQIYCYN